MAALVAMVPQTVLGRAGSVARRYKATPTVQPKRCVASDWIRQYASLGVAPWLHAHPASCHRGGQLSGGIMQQIHLQVWIETNILNVEQRGPNVPAQSSSRSQDPSQRRHTREQQHGDYTGTRRQKHVQKYDLRHQTTNQYEMR